MSPFSTAATYGPSSSSSSSNPNDGEDINLSPDVEDVLKQMGERFENNAGGGGAPPEDVADESDDSDEPEGEEK